MPSLDPTTRLLLVLGLGAGASSIAGRALDPLVGVLAGEFGTSAATVALLGTAFALPYALVQPVLGPVGDAIGKRRVIRACLVVLALALAASAAATDLATLGVLRVVAGGAAGGVFPLTIAVIGDEVPLARRQVALSRLLIAGLSGWALGGAIAALIEPVVGWRGVMLVCAAVALAGLLALRQRDPAGPRPRLNLGDSLARYRFILGQRAARVLYASVFVEGALVFGVFPFLAPLFAARGQGGAAEAGLALTAFAIGGFAFGFTAGTLLARLGQARMIMLGGALGAVGLWTLALAPLALAGILGCGVLGLGFYMIHSSIQTRVTEVAPQARGSAVALHAFSYFLGQSLGPVAMGAARAVLGEAAALLAAGAGLLVLAIWLAPQGARGGPKPPGEAVR